MQQGNQFSIGTILEKRFWKKVNRSEIGCWLWHGYIWTRTKKHLNYGIMKVCGHYKLAHRVSWEINKGLIPKGKCVLHYCDNPPCVRPDHLWLGTIQQNNLDKLSKGRHNAPKGTKHWRSILNEEKVKWIRSNNGKIPHPQMAKKLGVSRSLVQLISNHKRWSWIP